MWRLGAGGQEPSAYVHGFLVEPELVGERRHGSRCGAVGKNEKRVALPEHRGTKSCSPLCGESCEKSACSALRTLTVFACVMTTAYPILPPLR